MGHFATGPEQLVPSQFLDLHLVPDYRGTLEETYDSGSGAQGRVFSAYPLAGPPDSEVCLSMCSLGCSAVQTYFQLFYSEDVTVQWAPV